MDSGAISPEHGPSSNGAVAENMQSRMSELTLRTGQAALDQICASRQAATPRNYELWYSSVSGANPTLRESLAAAVNERRLSQSEFNNLFRKFFSAPVSPQRIAAIASTLIEQTKSAISSLEQADRSASQHRQALAGVNHRIAGTADRQDLVSPVQALALIAQGMNENCLSLGRKFDKSQQEIARLKGRDPRAEGGYQPRSADASDQSGPICEKPDRGDQSPLKDRGAALALSRGCRSFQEFQ
jgi:hypothetical protein